MFISLTILKPLQHSTVYDKLAIKSHEFCYVKLKQRSRTNEPPHDKTNKMTALAKTQISLGIRPVWSESSMSAWTKWRMPRMIRVVAGRTVILLVLSWGRSNPFLRKILIRSFRGSYYMITFILSTLYYPMDVTSFRGMIGSTWLWYGRESRSTRRWAKSAWVNSAGLTRPV